jgi:peroxiredoxin
MTSVIQPGDRIPAIPIKLVDASGSTDTTTDIVFGTGRVVFFAVPGAFTPTCDTNHLPGFLATAGKLREAGATRIVCGSVNDVHVMKAWAKSADALGTIDFLADGNGDFARALGLDSDKSASGMGVRFQRGAMIVDDGVVKSVFAESQPGVSVSGAPAILLTLQSM